MSGYSLKDLMKDAIKGDVQFVPNEVRVKRLDICTPCDKLKNRICTECGCFIDAKTKLSKSSCPLNKWSEYEQ